MWKFHCINCNILICICSAHQEPMLGSVDINHQELSADNVNNELVAVLQ